MSDISIGTHDTGFWDKGNTIIAKDKKASNTGFNAAKNTAENRTVGAPVDLKDGMNAEWDTGAEVIVGKKTSQGYTFDTYQIAIKDGGMSEKDKRVKDAPHVSFFDDAVSKLGGDEAYVVAEDNSIRILGDNSDRALSLKVIDHTKARELEAVNVLIAGVKDPNSKSTLNKLVSDLKNMKTNVEGKEQELKQNISSESSKLGSMEAPFKAKINSAQSGVNSANQVLQGAHEALTETMRPGYKLIDAALSDANSNVSNVSAKQKTLESQAVGDKSGLYQKATRIYQLEAKNAILWDKMNNPDGYTSPSSAYSSLVQNRKEITQLKKEIFLESSKIDRQSDLANALLPGVRSQLSAARELSSDIQEVKAAGKNQGDISANPENEVAQAKNKLKSAYDNLKYSESSKASAEKTLETSRKSIENYEAKLSTVFVLKEEINDIKFQLQNMDLYSNWANDWDKNRLKDSMVEKIFKISQLQSELGMINRMPSYNDIAREINSIVSKIPSTPNNTNSKDDPFSSGGSSGGGSVSKQKALDYANSIAGSDGWVSKEDLNKAGHGELADNGSLRDSVAGPDNKISVDEFASAIMDGKVKMKGSSGSSGSVKDDPFSGGGSGSSNNIKKDPWSGSSSGGTDYFSGLDNIYSDPFSKGNIYSDYNGKSQYGNDRDLMNGLVNSWNSAIQSATVFQKASNYNVARNQLSQVENDLARAQGKYQATVVNELKNLPNSTPQAIQSATSTKEKASEKLNAAQGVLNKANGEFQNDPALNTQRSKINGLKSQLENTSATFERLSEEARKKLGL